MTERQAIPASLIVEQRRAPVLKDNAMFSKASREFRLVAQCCVPQFASGPVFEGLLVAEDMDWKRVLRLAGRHRVTGLVHAALGQIESVPVGVRAALSKGATAIAMANMNALSTLAEVSSAFARAAIPFVVMKGLPVGQLAYGSATLRHSKDIDLLVAPECIDRANEVLIELDFRRAAASSAVSAEQEALWRQFRKHHDFVHARTGVHVEVHWRRSDNVHFAAPQLAADREIEVGGLSLRVPSETDMLLDLCLHGASHAWFRLKWVADVAALLAKAPADAGARLLAAAKLHDLDRPVEQCLTLCAALYPGLAQAAVPLPTKAGMWLARVASGALLEETTTSASAETDYVAARLKRSKFLLRRSWRYRLEEARVQAASPVDWEMLRLPGRLRFLYVLLRLPLWMKRRWLPGWRFSARLAASKH